MQRIKKNSHAFSISSTIYKWSLNLRPFSDYYFFTLVWIFIYMSITYLYMSINWFYVSFLLVRTESISRNIYTHMVESTSETKISVEVTSPKQFISPLSFSLSMPGSRQVTRYTYTAIADQRHYKIESR